MLPLLPVRILFNLLPVPLIFAVPVKVKFSIVFVVLGIVRIVSVVAVKVSVIVPTPVAANTSVVVGL
ncbi:MAG: hypothetical protein Kow0049_27660 [Stanieria sp.]